MKVVSFLIFSDSNIVINAWEQRGFTYETEEGDWHGIIHGIAVVFPSILCWFSAVLFYFLWHIGDPEGEGINYKTQHGGNVFKSCLIESKFLLINKDNTKLCQEVEVPWLDCSDKALFLLFPRLWEMWLFCMTLNQWLWISSLVRWVSLWH